MSHDFEEAGLSTPVGTRRSFFQWMTRLAAGIVALGLGVPLVGYVTSPAFKRREERWIEVGAVDQLPVGQPKQLEYVSTVTDGWLQTKSQKAVWAVKQTAEDVTVFSPMCTHLGCGYRWDEGERLFKCPCHYSVYDVTGRVLSGPAPRPLDVLPVKIENGQLYVLYKEFKAGLPRQVEL